jgi:Conserved hypothetical protein 2217 (DUF2460)
MLTFPTLKTGSVVQYPFAVSESFGTDVLEFLGGDEQRYLTTPGALRKWNIQLNLLDEAELRSVEEFFVATAGSFETFSFTDPASGISHPNCFIAGDDLQETFTGELMAGVTLVIQEGRG